ncbi:ribose-phosphate diphosphokinase [Nonomuraea wenchangensis]|uniref:ribose-phosphate diphosphokinase n=1 Tax=Nonomuraea wenchangensis TaxID=568860 RepID=UPI00342A9A07
MTGIKQAGEKKLMLFSGRAYPDLAHEVARELGTEIASTELREFANGEIYVRFAESVRGSDAFVIQCHCSPINTWIMEQLIMVDALKRASARRVTVVVPFFGYARQDKKHRGREPISARLMADLFAAAGADRIMTVDLHTAQIQGFFDGPVDHLHALPLLAEHVTRYVDTDRLTVVAPDAGRVRVAEKWTDRLHCPLAIIHKRRDPERPNEVSVHEVVGDVAGRTCVIIDDMIDTGGTVVRAAQALTDRGATQVIAAATHGVFSDDAVERLEQAGLAQLVITNTLPSPASIPSGGLVVLSIAPLLARAISEVFREGSVTSLFEGES